MFSIFTASFSKTNVHHFTATRYSLRSKRKLFSKIALHLTDYTTAHKCNKQQLLAIPASIRKQTSMPLWTQSALQKSWGLEVLLSETNTPALTRQLCFTDRFIMKELHLGRVVAISLAATQHMKPASTYCVHQGTAIRKEVDIPYLQHTAIVREVLPEDEEKKMWNKILSLKHDVAWSKLQKMWCNRDQNNKFSTKKKQSEKFSLRTKRRKCEIKYFP